MVNLNDVLLAMSNIPVDDPIAEIWGRGLQGGYKNIEYTGSLPITINANGDALIDYRICGADGGVGEPTENLFDTAKKTKGAFIDVAGRIISNSTAAYSDLIAVEQMTYYVCASSKYYGLGSWILRVHGYDENGNWVKQIAETTSFTQEGYHSLAITIDDTEIKKIRISYFYAWVNWLTFSEQAMSSYIPYGYKLPMTVSDGNTEQIVPVYIGENQLEENEYVSFSEQKIYRDVSGTLTPTDPPVPLPEIPTIKGETVIDYDGTPKPSQMYVKYKGKG